ncbi:MAG: PASTA domain-containing protein [Bacteroidales bacterium]|nr:PASTA domain-containing protein [Bacteroidales bacterium]
MAKKILIHILLQFVIFIVIIGIIYAYLSSYTYHNISIEVPDLRNLTVKDAVKIAGDRGFKIVIADSMFLIDKPKGIVISQVPEPKQKVKPERKIFLIINGYSTPKVSVPNLEGLTLRQAIAECELYGLKIGKVNFVPDISNTVVKQYYKGKEIKGNMLIPRGSYIDVDVGQVTNAFTNIVCVIGNTIEKAKELLTLNGLNLGAIIGDNTIKTKKDSMNAIIWKQTPVCNYSEQILTGTFVDVWITLDTSLLLNNSYKSQ